MLELLIASLPSLLPQDPPAVPPTTTATSAATTTSLPATWLPETTLAALVVEPTAADGPMAQLWASSEGAACRELAQRLLQPALGELQLTFEQLDTALRGGFALGFVGFTAGHQPDVVFVADLGTAIVPLTRRIEQLPAAEGLRVLGTGAPRVLIGTREGHVALGTDAATVQAALDRATGATGSSLADELDFARSRSEVAGHTLGQLFVRLGDLAAAVVDQVPKEMATPVRRSIDVLGIADMHFASATWTLDGEDLTTRWAVEAPRAEGLFDALAGTVGRLDPSLARFVPTGAEAYGFFTVQFGTVFDEVLALGTAIQPAAASMASGQIDQVSDRAGIDVRAEIVGGLAGRMVTFAMPGTEPQAGVLLELRQGPAFARSLGKLLEALPLPLETGTTGGVPCWRTTGQNGIAPAFAVVGSWLVLGSSDAALATATRQIQEPRADPKVLAMLRKLPPDATGAAVAPLASLASTWFTQLPTPTDDYGSRTLVMRRTSDAFVAEQRASASGTIRSVAGTMTAMMTPSTPSATPTTDPVATGTDDGQAARTLREVEAEGSTRANITTVAAMLSHGDVAIVARAAWLLGEWKAQDAIVLLGDVAREHADAGVRLQATAALARIGGSATAQGLTRALQDPDTKIRACAMQALGRLGAQVAKSPAMQLVDKFGSVKATDAPTDLVAALVVLHDLGDPTTLAQIASGIGFPHPQVGQALAFLFQGLSPKLTPKEEVTTLLAVLDHPEPLLRKYAIQRLGELRDPTTAKALEGRLASETDALQPLLRVSLTQVRGDEGHADDDLVARAKSNVAAISQMVERSWNRLGATGKIATGGSIGAVLLGVVGFLVMRRRSRYNAQIAEAQALVEPSAGYAASGRGTRYQHDAFAEQGDLLPIEEQNADTAEGEAEFEDQQRH